MDHLSMLLNITHLQKKVINKHEPQLDWTQLANFNQC